MKNLPLLLVAALSSSSAADSDPHVVRGETIIIHDYVPPPVLPKPKKSMSIAPRYSDAAIERDAWTKAWLLLDIDERGSVARVKFLNRPGYDLDDIALRQALGTKFEPARDHAGNPTRSYIIWPIEWPSYWWMVALTGLATRIPGAAVNVPCAGSGPLHLDSLHPVYRDCSSPDLSAVDREPWVTASALR